MNSVSSGQSLLLIPSEILRDILYHLSPLDLFLNIRPVSKHLKSAACIVIRNQLFQGSECEVGLHPIYIMRPDAARNITCHSAFPAPGQEGTCTWVGSAEKLKNEWTRLESYRRDITVIPQPLWTWMKVYRMYYDHCSWIEIVRGQPPINPTGDRLEEMCWRVIQLNRSRERDEAPWSLDFAMERKKDGEVRYSIIIQLPLWGLVNMYSLYEEICPQLTRNGKVASMTSDRTKDQCLNTSFIMSDLRRKRRKSREWEKFVESLIANSA